MRCKALLAHQALHSAPGTVISGQAVTKTNNDRTAFFFHKILLGLHMSGCAGAGWVPTLWHSAQPLLSMPSRLEEHLLPLQSRQQHHISCEICLLPV